MAGIDGKSATSLARAVPLWLAILFFLSGGLLGYGAGVLSVKAARDFFQSLFQSEQRANLATRNTIDRPAFRCEFPGNWKVDTADSDYDPDHLFSIHTPGQSFLMFIIADVELDAEEVLENHAAAQTEKTLRGRGGGA